MTKNKNKYKDIGVDIEEGQKFIEDIKDLTKEPITSYSLSSSTVDALEVVVNRDDTDIQLTRISFEEYLLSRFSV